MALRSLASFALALAGAASAGAQTLVCPPSAATAGHPCDTYHFHVAMYRPDTRAFVELYGINRFASLTACERARDVAVKRNVAVVAALRRRDDQYPADRFGPCHCDGTIDKSNPDFLSDEQRAAQFREEGEIRQRIRERLLEQNEPTDSEVMRDLAPSLASTPLLGGPRLVPLPPAVATSVASRDPQDLMMSKTLASPAPSMASLDDLPLVNIDLPGVAPDATSTPGVISETSTPPTPGTPGAVAAAAPPVSAALAPAAAAPAEKPLPEERISVDSPSARTPRPPVLPAAPLEAAPPPPAGNPTATAPPPSSLQGEASAQPADETAEVFISFETARIQSVLKASNALGDDAIRSRVFETCMQRIQLLSNLRSIITGSGAQSRLARAVRSARTEADRLALVAALFGSDMPAHWAPGNAGDVVLEPKPDVDTDPEKVLRDTSGLWSLQQKKRALYILLARSQPTEEQQLWLGSVIDAFLR